MKPGYLRVLTGLLVVVALVTGCVVHDHGHHRGGAGVTIEEGHVHGHGCGHELRGGVWIAVP